MIEIRKTTQERLADLTSVAPAFSSVTGVFFLLLWDAGGRVVTHRYLVDGLFDEVAHRANLDTLRWCSGKCRRIFKEAGWPVEIKAIRDIGYRLDVEPDWKWENSDAP